MEDCRSTSLGGLRIGLDIWESAYIPSLMSNSSTWMEIKDSTIEKLEEVQNSLYRNILNVPHTTPKASLIWEVGGLKMKYRIMMNKLIFMNHIIHLGENTLAKQIQMAQELHSSPGLTSEVKDFIAKLGLPNCFEEKIPKNKWKSIVKKSIHEANEAEIRESLKTYKKVNYSNIQAESFECKEYISSLTLSQARVL